MPKREAAMQQVFGRWLQYAYTGPTAVFELKRTLTRSLPMSEIKEHQVRALAQVEDGFYHKLPDDTIAQKPFDCFFLRDAPAYLVVAYGTFLKGFYLIPAKYITRFKQQGIHSITEKMAQTFGTYVPISRDNSSVRELLPFGER